MRNLTYDAEAMLILGHRGASADFPENTLPAFEAAVRQRADGVELDVMRCASGELVVCHDEELSRLAHLPWVVARTPWWKLQKADVGRGARIPLLDEVLDAVPAPLAVNVELKCEDVDDRGLSVAVGALLERRGEGGRIFVSSFNPLCLARLAAAYPDVRRGLLIDPDRAWFPQAWVWQPLVGRDSVHPHHAECTAARVDFWHARGLKVATWTVDDAQRARELKAMGVDVLITNRPGWMRDQL